MTCTVVTLSSSRVFYLVLIKSRVFEPRVNSVPNEHCTTNVIKYPASRRRLQGRVSSFRASPTFNSIDVPCPFILFALILTHLPIQKSLKITSSTSSAVTSPVIRPRLRTACLKCAAVIARSMIWPSLMRRKLIENFRKLCRHSVSRKRCRDWLKFGHAAVGDAPPPQLEMSENKTWAHSES